MEAIATTLEDKLALIAKLMKDAKDDPKEQVRILESGIIDPQDANNCEGCQQMERPPKPELEYEYKQEGEVVVKQLTQESERKWSEYLRLDHFARVAIYKASQKSSDLNTK